mmetsp:Transcript_7103/g.12870  ORF Transcript_7103/g.12870 Transcript_7103/m.12870 type:complete len:129 (-) Transcript_7103:55-441(-)
MYIVGAVQLMYHSIAVRRHECNQSYIEYDVILKNLIYITHMPIQTYIEYENFLNDILYHADSLYTIKYTKYSSSSSSSTLTRHLFLLSLSLNRTPQKKNPQSPRKLAHSPKVRDENTPPESCTSKTAY